MHGLGEVAVHSSAQAAFAVAGHGVGRHRHDADALAGILFAAADFLGGLEPVHLRHLHIHENDVEARCGPNLQCFAAILRQRYLVAGLFEMSVALVPLRLATVMVTAGYCPVAAVPALLEFAVPKTT